MAKITLTIGSVQSSSSGTVQRDTRREVEFDGEKLAEYHEAGEGRDGLPTDTRGTTETLYKASDGRLVAHVHDWSHWQGEPDTWRLYEVNEADLSGRGRFSELGRAAGYGRPLTLDEALTPLERLEYGEPEPTTYTVREGQCCERCGKPLPASASPYHQHEGGPPVYLCDQCADPGDA